MEWLPASSLPLDQLCQVWNGAYEGYLYPMNHTVELLDRMIRTGSMNLDQSVLLRVEGAWAGLSFLGVRADRGWIGSFGVLSPFRGKGLAGPLIQEQLRWAWRYGLGSVQLEVLYKNETAKRVYERAGFAVKREVAILSGRPGAYPAQRVAGAQEIPAQEGQRLLSQLSGRSAPTWQREPASFVDAVGAKYIAVGEDGALAYEERPTGIRVLDVAAAAGADQRQVALALMTALSDAAGERPAMVINEPEGALLDALREAGLQETDRQYEMTIYSSSGDSPRRNFSA